MVEKITYFVVLPFLFYACSTIHNKKHFNFQKSITEKRIKTDGYYYCIHNYDENSTNKGVYLSLQVFLNNGYTYIVKNGFGNQCGDSITLDCATKMSEYMLDKNINEFLVDTNKQSGRNYHIWNWGKYQIVNDTITVKWFYNRFGEYYLAEQKGVVLDSTTINFFYFKDYKSKKEIIYPEPKKYHFKSYPIEKIYDKIPKKMVQWE
ncbi:hypothetical protein [Capnocytophaga cynodegmi]|uniref:hypothetical protein n=1 Tax=Capnocytophaga cynodegmi TaxID=28189 RepID=UPI0003607F92|nr:hypothetical protein [Capnocytophaga cynodegmi]CEN42290.1 conserved hypothetical protein [Capnocytophaga cynodegmi]